MAANALAAMLSLPPPSHFHQHAADGNPVAAEPFRRLLGGARELVQRHAGGNILGLRPRPLGDGLGLGRVLRPFRGVLAIVVVGCGHHLDELHHEIAIGLGPVLVRDIAVERGLAGVGRDLAGGDDHLAVLLHFGEHRVPDERGLDVAALPCGANFRRPHVEDLHVGRIDLGLVERDHGVEVRGRIERHGDLLALQIRERVDAGAVLGDQRLRRADVVEDPEKFERLAA